MKTILFVDDELHRISSLIDLFEDDGYKIATASSAAEALRFLSDKSFTLDLIILDMIMGYDGVDFSENETDFGLHTGLVMLRRIRESRPEVPVIIYTANPDHQVERSAIDVGAAAYFVRPVNYQTLLQTVKDLTTK